MNKPKTVVVIICCVIFSAIFSEPGSGDSLLAAKFPGLENFLLPCWKATCIQYPDSNWIPVNRYRECIAPPLFNIHFEDTCHLVPRSEGLPDEVQPNLMLCFYPVSQKATLTRIIDESGVFSWCIPIIYDETDEYCIITSPCFRNNGHMGDPVRKYFDPQDSALHTFFSISGTADESTGYRNNFHKSIHGSNTNVLKQFFINGRIKMEGNTSPQPTIRRSDSKYRASSSRWILQLPPK